ncbi:hypothetical protein [Nostoc sp. ChiQUE01b]|uniref:hypothetical protein n=1 Tax=Nostoc sp. ChiQUE01b TaxID=3075376 RepID=UPI002AD2A4FC|nr:hypothetical protein [Nostoc sp. ChiQUE01b]MDZ8259912.1 hypothetical protein [Nostoc sp. ChiQUE01b]
MFTIANPFIHQTALGSRSNSLLSQNRRVRPATDLLDETLHCMITSHRFSKRASLPNKSNPSLAAPQTKQ